jgi:hypothetical protein
LADGDFGLFSASARVVSGLSATTSMLQTYKSPSVRVEQDKSTDVPHLAEVSSAERLATLFGFIRRRFVTILAWTK